MAAGSSRSDEDEERACCEEWYGPESGSDVADLCGQECSQGCGGGEEKASEGAADAESDAADNLIDGQHTGGLSEGHVNENKFGHGSRDAADPESEDCHGGKDQDERFGRGREDCCGDHHGDR